MREFDHDAQVEEIVRRFEQCEYELAEFDHARHLCVGMAYLREGGLEPALERMRSSLRRFGGHHGKQGYHETLTRFWLLRLAEALEEMGDRPLWQACNHATVALADKDLVYRYYDRERLMSDEARQQWVHPNKSPDSCPGSSGGM